MTLQTRTEADENRVNMGNVSIVLVRPKHSGNIGSVARCASNTDVEHIIVVDPREIDREEIDKMATHAAKQVVEKIRCVYSLDEALASFQYVVGTTARRGGSNLRGAIMSSTDLGAAIAPVSRVNRVALVFGPEDRGLTNRELQRCHIIAGIPTSENFTSLNLSHAVMIVCYELFSWRGEHPAPPRIPRLASSVELEAMYDSLRDLFLKIDFINAENPDYWMVAVRNLFSRTTLRARDVKIIRGICRQVERYGEGKTSGSRKQNKNLDIPPGDPYKIPKATNQAGGIRPQSDTTISAGKGKRRSPAEEYGGKS
ncbi:MAG TPA: RNA methyltransferase [Deltaproteobacteria bacterium]|nr:RNA methyltransferase [Deltaproteobacteria bacterium]